MGSSRRRFNYSNKSSLSKVSGLGLSLRIIEISFLIRERKTLIE